MFLINPVKGYKKVKGESFVKTSHSPGSSLDVSLSYLGEIANVVLTLLCTHFQDREAAMMCRQHSLVADFMFMIGIRKKPRLPVMMVCSRSLQSLLYVRNQQPPLATLYINVSLKLGFL